MGRERLQSLRLGKARQVLSGSHYCMENKDREGRLEGEGREGEGREGGDTAHFPSSLEPVLETAGNP